MLWLALGTIAGAISQGLILRRFLAQLNQVSQVSRELAAGHLSHRLPTDNTVVELSQLARAINQLADQTQQSPPEYANSFNRLRAVAGSIQPDLPQHDLHLRGGD